MFVTVIWIIRLVCFLTYHGKISAAYSKRVDVSSISITEQTVVQEAISKPSSYIALLTFDGNYQEPSVYGTIISPNWILTAASCTVGKLYVVATWNIKLNVKGPYTNVSSKNFHRHENYDPNCLYYYDIALIQTEEIIFSDAVQPIKLPEYGLTSYENSDANVFNVGVDMKDAKSGILRFQYKMVGILKNTTDCIDVKNNYTALICAYSTDGLISPTVFQAELAHPLTRALPSGEHIQIGINIKEYTTSTASRFIYTSTSFFRNWIANKTGI